MGAVGVREMMEMTPCDIFGYIRGRTVWLVGDSMMQVRCSCCEALLVQHCKTGWGQVILAPNHLRF